MGLDFDGRIDDWVLPQALVKMVAGIPVWSRQQLILGGMVMLCIVAGSSFLASYLMLDLNLILAGIAAPIVLRVRQPGQVSYRYGFLAGVSLALFAGVHMSIFFLLAVGGTIIFLIESSRGKMGILPLVLLVLMSSVPAYLADVMTFPLRLWMSEQTAWMLSGIGSQVSQHGNIFSVNGNEFAVDAACMGLQSLVTGLIITTLLISLTEQRTRRMLSGWYSLLLLAATLLLVLLGNFIRMLSLVLFQSMPDTLSHELIGVLGLLIYVIAPMALLTRWVVKRWGVPISVPSERNLRLNPSHLVIAALLIGGIAYCNFNRQDFRNTTPDEVVSSLELPGFEKTILENGIAKFEQDHVLIYLKPPVHFWGSDHSPNICWRASGFQLYGMSEAIIGTQKVYTAELRKGSEVFYTAWWYENGEMKTHSQLEWRLQRLQGAAPFRLVNVTASSPDQLVEECLELFSIGQAEIGGGITSSITGVSPDTSLFCRYFALSPPLLLNKNQLLAIIIAQKHNLWLL